MEKPCRVGLFGTCRNSTWRKPVITTLNKLGVTYFNPQFFDREYTMQDASRETYHLKHDQIILIAVTDETPAFLSIAEIGIAIAQVISSKNRRIVVYLAPKVKSGQTTPEKEKDSNKVRKTIISHLKRLKHPRVSYASSLLQLKKMTYKLLT